MAWRKGFVRGLVFSILGLCGCALIWYQRFTNPEAVRQQVLENFKTMFPGAEVSLESARLRLLGGISIRELRMWRKDDPEKVEFARIPAAVLYHDKEKMLDGPLVLRKIELQKPRFKVRRGPDGKWNLQGLAAPSRPEVPQPTLVIQQGTLVFEDRATDGTGLTQELTDVNLTLINDPVSVLNVEGTAESVLAGKVRIHAAIQRGTGEVTASIKAQSVPLCGTWSEKIACGALADKVEGLVLKGQAEVAAELAYRPGQSQPFTYDVSLEVKKAWLRHPLLPLPLEELEASVRLAAGEVRVERVQARSGKAVFEGRALARLPHPERDWEAHLELKHLAIDAALTARGPDKLRLLQEMFQVKGPATVRVAAAYRDGGYIALPDGSPSTVTLVPENLSACFQRFPMPLTRVTGRIKHDLLAHKTETDVTVFAGERPVVIKGTWEGQGDAVRCQFDIAASELVIDEHLLAALPETQEQRVRSFHPTGKIDVTYHLSREPGEEFRGETHLRYHGGTACWDLCPYEVENLSGLIDIFPDQHMEFRDFQGTHKNGGKVFLSGRAFPRADGTTALVVEMTGKQVALDQDLRRALQQIPGLGKTWDTLRPRGRMDFSAVVDRTAPRLEDMEVRLTVNGGSVVPTFFPYTFESCAGKVRYRRNRVEIERMYARRRDMEMSIVAGTIDLNPGGGLYADLSDVRFRQLHADDELQAALPPALSATVKALDMRGALAGKARLVAAQPAEPGAPTDLFWDGQFWFNELKFFAGLEVSGAAGTLASRGRFNGRQLQGVNGNLILETATLLNQPFRNVHSSLMVLEDQPQILLLNLNAPVHGGAVTGQVRMEFGPSLRYDLNLTAGKIDLERLGHNIMGPKNQLKGSGMGRLVLSGQGAGVNSLEGGGSIDVYQGHILNLPLLLDLLKFLGLRWPDRTAFEEIHAQFAIQGRRVQVGRLELLGSPISLYGKGGFNLDGSEIELDFYPSWARVEQILPPAVRSLPPAISKNLLTIEMRGKVGGEGDLKFHKKPLPLLLDPVLQMRDWITGPPNLVGPQIGAAPGRGKME